MAGAAAGCEKERALLAVLPDYDGSSEEAAAGFFAEVADLYNCVILNYLAILKIVKKHDKNSASPIRQQVVELVFTQAFYLSLEHSYLFSAYKERFSRRRSSSKDDSNRSPSVGSPPRKKERAQQSSGSSGGSLFGGAIKNEAAETLEVPAHLIECCLLHNGAIVGAALDFSALRTDATNRTVEMQIEALLSFAGVAPLTDAGAGNAAHEADEATSLTVSTTTRERSSSEPIARGAGAASPTSCSSAAVATPPRRRAPSPALCFTSDCFTGSAPTSTAEDVQDAAERSDWEPWRGTTALAARVASTSTSTTSLAVVVERDEEQPNPGARPASELPAAAPAPSSAAATSTIKPLVPLVRRLDSDGGGASEDDFVFEIES